jgi:acyl-[acyl-carrier-protein]-phospholipid O-acyltransferase / long-chain-fatty-acid--[acyl-carrier-protein] ligase
MLLHQQFVKMARKYSGKLAIRDKTTKKDVTYERALIGALILKSKFSRYDKGFLGIMIPTSAGCALAKVATLMSGRIPVMINYSTGAEANAKYAQKKCHFTTIITSKALLEKINCPVIEGMVFIEDLMAGVTIFEKLGAAVKAKMPSWILLRLIHKGEEDDTCVILFTSGSEKDPKAVQLTHRNISSNIESFGTMIGLTADDVLLANLVFFHVFGLTVDLWVPFLYGMTMICYSNPLDFQAISTIAREEKPTIMVGTPSFFWGYLQKSEPGDFKSLRLMIAGADKCPDSLREGYMKKHETILLEGYGATETSPVISVNTPDANKPGSVGKVIPGVKVRLENFETGEECRPGETGKIMVKGDLVMKGYFEDQELTDEVLKDGWYNTGDMGFFDEDGFLYHAGRFKRFAKIGGEMISLVKVENIMEKYLPEGVICCLVDIPDEKKGSYIMAAVSAEVHKTEILRKMMNDLPSIALPREFIVLDSIPMMSTGKVDVRSVTRIVQEKIKKNT